MSNRQVSLRSFNARTPQPRTRTPRGNFRYSTWIAQGVQLVGGTRTAPDTIAPQTLAPDELLHVFLFGADNVARAQMRTWNPMNEYQSVIVGVTTVRAYSAALTYITPAVAAGPYESVYAEVNGVSGIRGTLCESVSDVAALAAVNFSLDVTFDSGVISGVPAYRGQSGVTRNPVLLLAEDFSQEIVNAGYTITANNGDVGVVVGVFEITSTGP